MLAPLNMLAGRAKRPNSPRDFQNANCAAPGGNKAVGGAFRSGEQSGYGKEAASELRSHLTLVPPEPL